MVSLILSPKPFDDDIGFSLTQLKKCQVQV
jgi:hypothetical protein